MAKRFMALLLALLLLLSLSACASAPAGSVESPSHSPAVAAEPSDSPALPEDIELGEVYDKSTVELPGNSVYLQDAVTTGSRLFLYGLDESQTPCFYIMDAGTRSIEPYAIDVPGSIAAVCQSRDDVQAVLAIDEAGQSVLHMFSDGAETGSVTLALPKNAASDVILGAALVGEHLIITGANELLLYGIDGTPEKSLGEYSRFAACILNNDGTVLICHGVPAALGAYETKTCFTLLDSGMNELGRYELQEEFSSFHKSAKPGHVLVRGGNTLYKLDYASGEKAALIDCFTSSMHTNTLISLDDDSYFGIESGRPVLWSLPDGSSVVTLTLAAYNANYPLLCLIEEYNAQSTGYKISVIDYAEFDAQGVAAGMTRLQADIAAGFAPDMYDLANLPVEKYVKAGLLDELSPWFGEGEEVSLADFVPGAARAMAADGELYYITPSFSLLLMAAPDELVGSRERWTPGEFLDITAGHSPAELLGTSMTPEDFISYVLLFNGSEYIDRESLTCHFADSGFAELLEFAAQLPDSSASSDSGDFGQVYLGDQLLLPVQLGTAALKLLSFIDAAYHGNARCIGFPSESGTGIAVTPSVPVGVSVSSHHKDGARDFLYYLLGSGGQSSPNLPHIPVIQSALDARMERWVEEYKEFTPALAQYVDGEPLTIECTAPAEDISRALYALIDRASLVNTTDSELLQIVLRESKVYFGGGTTARQAAQAIDAKVQLYLAEQYG